MFVGHYAIAMAAKKAAPNTSLGTLVAAAIFLDIAWPFFLLAGLERVVVDPTASAFTPLRFVSYPWSHSLLTAMLWGLSFAAVYFLVRKYTRGAIVAGLLVVSHWLLDWPMHVPDLPLTPWSNAGQGLGLWNFPFLTLAIELAMLAAGVFLYRRATQRRDAAGFWTLIAFIVLLLAFYAAAAFGPPPPSPQAVAYAGFGQFLMIAFAALVDRHRAVRLTAAP